MKQSAMSPRTGRIIELDIAKGLGILSVILYNTLPASPLHTALGDYMMPLFFVVSGLVMQGMHAAFLSVVFGRRTPGCCFITFYSAPFICCAAR